MLNLKHNVFIFFFIIFRAGCLFSDYILIPMNDTQANHLKAYGIAYTALKAGLPARWLLNYQNGAFLIDANHAIEDLSIKRGVSYRIIDENEKSRIENIIKTENMADIKLEKAPRIAVYTPPDKSPWADAVTLALTYAEIPFDKIYDEEVLSGDLEKYDWLHLHHEDFTGQFSKFWMSYHRHPWFQEKVSTMQRIAEEAGFETVREHKLAVAKTIQLHTSKGLFLFAMCTATETIDVALAAGGVDIVPVQIDGTGIDKAYQQKLDYSKTFAFTDFEVYPQIHKKSFSDIDYNQVNTPNRREVSDFLLFEFSAKLDPVPALLCQNHRSRISGFYGQTTSFQKQKIKDGVMILAESINGTARYIHGSYGEGSFTFYGGHAPEDKNHYVGDEAPNVDLYRNSPGYRLILNNVLFPSAKPPDKKT